MSEGIFVIGTDTDVGKTLVSAALGWRLRKKISKVCAMKPFATGKKIFSSKHRSEDVSILVKSIGFQENDLDINPYYYEMPCSPFMAARILNQRPPNLIYAAKKFQKLSKKYDFIVVEGIGGLFVPLNSNKSLLDFIKMINLDVVIVTTPKVGTFNHTLLTVSECLRNNINIRGIIVNKMSPNSSLIENQTPRYLEMVSNVPILGVLPQLNNFTYDEKILDIVSSNIDFRF